MMPPHPRTAIEDSPIEKRAGIYGGRISRLPAVSSAIRWGSSLHQPMSHQMRTFLAAILVVFSFPCLAESNPPVQIATEATSQPVGNAAKKNEKPDYTCRSNGVKNHIRKDRKRSTSGKQKV